MQAFSQMLANSTKADLDALENPLGGLIGWNLAIAAPWDRLGVACTMSSITSPRLAGPISPSLVLVPNFQVLDLSSNNFTLGSVPNMKVFNVSIKHRQKWITMAIVASAAAVLIAISGCCYCAFIILLLRCRLCQVFTGDKKRSQTMISARNSNCYGEPELVMFSSNFSYTQVLDATQGMDEETVVLRRGKYGIVYKASFYDGTTLAILRLINISVEEVLFLKEVKALSKVKHPNLTILRGYYAGPHPNVRLLVYDYMPNGNLATILETAGNVLNWPMRHLIVLGIARGLTFLHTLSIVHGDVTPQNILFDADFEAHLAHFGLDKLSAISSPTGTVGYASPEVVRSGKATKEGDVYSFGIVLLELLTGKRPAVFAGEVEDTVNWVKRMLERSQVLTKGLLGLGREDFSLGVKVALLCTLSDPIDRPPMSEVLLMLEGCRAIPDIFSLPIPPCLCERSTVIGPVGDEDGCRRRRGWRRKVKVGTTCAFRSIKVYLKIQISRFEKKIKGKKSFV